MFGWSKGAYIIRSVVGMINNCVIAKSIYRSDGRVDEEKTHKICQEATTSIDALPKPTDQEPSNLGLPEGYTGKGQASRDPDPKLVVSPLGPRNKRGCPGRRRRGEPGTRQQQ